MMLRTHLAIGVFAVLLFLPHVTEKAIFIVVAVIAIVIIIVIVIYKLYAF